MIRKFQNSIIKKLKLWHENFISLPFIKKENGELHFHNWGFGTNYIIDSDETEIKLRRLIKQGFWVGLPFTIAGFFIEGWIGLAVIFTPIFIYEFLLYKIIHRLQKAADKPTLKKSIKAVATLFPIPILTLGLICCFIMLGFLFYIIILFPPRDWQTAAIFITLFMLTISIVWLIFAMIQCKRKT